MQPRLAALLFHDASRSPGCEAIVEALIGGAYRFQVRKRYSGVIKIGEVAHTIVSRARHDPGKTAATECVSEPAAVLEQEQRVRAEGRVHGVPVDGVVKINVEVCNDGLPLSGHVRRRGKIRLLHVLQ